MDINNEIKISKKRIIGAAFFGLILGNFVGKAFEFSIPRILAMVKKIDFGEAELAYADATFLPLISGVAAVFFGAMVAGFLARKKGILVGLMASSVYIILFGSAFILSLLMGSGVYIGSISAQLWTFSYFILAVIAGIFGGYFGEKFYSPGRDWDLGKNKLTVFGIRWFHYFWIFPIVLYSFLATFIIAAYAAILIALTDLYFAIHPSLWLSISWWAFLIFMPIFGGIPIYLLSFSFSRFWELMQYQQVKSSGWKRIMKIILYGIGAPSLGSIIAYSVAAIAHNMPKPATGDWKIGIGLIFLIPGIYLIVRIFSWIKDKFSH